jgi:YVTN family beta-propeller protein
MHRRLKNLLCSLFLLALWFCVLPQLSGAQTPSPALLVLNKEDSTLSIIDPTSLKTVGQVDTGAAPHELAVSTDGKFAYVANYGSTTPGNTLSVIDLVAQKEIHRVDLGEMRRPHGIEFLDGKVYFTSEVSKCLGVYDPSSNKVQQFLRTDQDRTHMLLFSKDGRLLFTANVQAGTISAFRLNSSSGKWDATVIPVGTGAEGMDLSPDGKQLWTANAGDGTVSIIDVASNKVLETPDIGAKHSNRLKFTPDGKRVLVSDMGGNQLIVLDAATHKEIKRLDIGRQPEGILMPGNGRAYIALGGERTVVVLDLEGFTPTARISVGNGPDGMAWAARR